MSCTLRKTVLAAASACALNFVIVYFRLRSSGSAAVESERVSAAVQNLYGHRNVPGQHWHSHGNIGMGGGMYKLAYRNSVGCVLVVVGVEVKLGPPAERGIINQILTHMKN
jgi:hypothetical protein